MNSPGTPAQRPWSIRHDGGFTVEKDGLPALLVGGQVFNSSSSSPQSIADSFAQVRRMNANVVLAPVSWAQMEPAEGTFDFTLLDRMIDEARSAGLRLVLLWFGAFKNAASTYAPRWVRVDRERFPRAVVESKGMQAFSYQGATAKPVLSVFSPELRESDARAFENLVEHLVASDPDGVVAMIQVENETGLLSDSRDRGPLAEAAWNAQVPPSLLEHFAGSGGSSPARDVWHAHGSLASGTWPEVLGDTSAAEEIFMAWGFASYVEHLAGRGRAIADIPMYANAWLGPQPGQDEPGQWPSGGPASRVLDVWRVAAPSLALLGPDIHLDDADGAMRAYATGVQPFFVPESRLNAAELVRAVGAYRAIGWSAFGLDGGNPDGQVAATLGFLSALEGEIAAAQRAGCIGAIVIEPGIDVVNLEIDGVDISARATLALLQRMLLDAGVHIPDPEVNVPSETLPDAPIPHFGDTRPFGLLIGSGLDSFIVVGRELTLDFFAPATRIEIDSVEELLLEDGRLVPGRVLNGDERLRIIPTDRVGAARIRLARV